ncbi:MAG TPA: hypothetical protein VFZ02_02625 [Ktedonobacteraceae bacterium]
MVILRVGRLGSYGSRGEHQQAERSTRHTQAGSLHELVERLTAGGLSNGKGRHREVSRRSNRGGDVVPRHITLIRVRPPGRGHWPGQGLVLAPARACIDGRGKAHIDLAGRGATACMRPVIVRHGQVSPAARGAAIDRQPCRDMLDSAANSIEGDALHGRPG